MMKQEKDEKPTAQTCPDCGGAMRQENLGTLTHFRCHIGHAMTAEVLAAAQLTKLEYDICAIQRTLNERAALCRELSEKHRANGNSRAAETWGRAAEEAQGARKYPANSRGRNGPIPKPFSRRRNERVCLIRFF